MTGTEKGSFELRSERLGSLPVVNHFFGRLGLEGMLERHVPSSRDRRCRLPTAKGLGVLLRSIVVEREPIYRQQETVATYAPEAFALSEEEAGRLRDDALGRALDRLFLADRAALLTEVVVATRKRFSLRLEELHNDTTSIAFTGQYRSAQGRSIRGKRAPWITYGFSKDHRGDLKQLIFVLTSSADGGVPVQFRCEDGQTNDTRTHIETWEALREATGKTDFLYVADSKLCTFDNLHHIHRRGGRLVCVMPRTRREDKDFRKWIQSEEPAWEEVWDRPHPRRRDGPRDRWSVFRFPLPSREAWPVIWVYSTLLRRRQQQGRQRRLARATEQLCDLDKRLQGPRPRLRSRRKVEDAVQAIVEASKVERYLRVRLWQEEQKTYRQERRGRPGPKTRYHRVIRKRWRVRWALDQARIAYDEKSDGMYPLLTNDRSLTPSQVLKAHKRQPVIEKRFEQIKTVHEIAPVFLKNEGRIEALFFLYFLALLVQALIERELRRAMEREKLDSLPIYPEERPSRRPTSQQVLRLFSHVQRHTLLRHDRQVQAFPPKLTELQREILRLLGVPPAHYCGT